LSYSPAMTDSKALSLLAMFCVLAATRTELSQGNAPRIVPAVLLTGIVSLPTLSAGQSDYDSICPFGHVCTRKLKREYRGW